MKVKSLLLAGMAVFALSSNAQYLDCTSYVEMDMKTALEGVEVGTRTSFIPVTLTRVDEAEDFTNFQVSLTLPEGLRLAANRASSDTETWDDDAEENVQRLAWTVDYHWTDGVPDDYIMMIAANLTKTALTKNPIELGSLRFWLDAELEEGAVIHSWDLKYTDYADNTWRSTREDNFICKEKKEDSAVENINAGKAVASVKYYNAAGIAADQAFDGVNIVVTTYADGTQNTVKVVK